MTDQDERTGRRGRVDDALQVLAELFEYVRIDHAAFGSTVAALVLEHQSCHAAQIAALVVPRVLVVREAVAEDHGQVINSLGRLVDLDVQPRAVGSDDRNNGSTQRAELLVRLAAAAGSRRPRASPR